MIKKKFVCTPVLVKAFCECGGEFEPGGLALTSNPPQYSYRCSKCGKEVFLTETYPHLEYETGKELE